MAEQMKTKIESQSRIKCINHPVSSIKQMYVKSDNKKEGKNISMVIVYLCNHGYPLINKSMALSESALYIMNHKHSRK